MTLGMGDVRTYYVWSGIHLVGSAPHPYIHNITLMDAIDRTVGVEDREDGLYIGGKKYEEGWAFSFDTDAFETVNKTLSGLPDPSIFDLLNITIAQGWTLIIKTAPDTEPPVIHWASYSEDRKTIAASVSDNLFVRDVSAHVNVGYGYRDIKLKDEDGDQVFTATLSEEITDTYDDYLTATDGKFIAIFNDLRLIPYWWPMFRHDTSHTGSSLSNAPDNNNLLWSYKTGNRTDSSPAVADGKVFIGSSDNKVYCLRESDGVTIWSYPTGGSVGSSPAVADGKVFVTSGIGIMSYDLNLWPRWGYAFDEPFSSSPVVADGKVFVSSFDHNIYCFGSPGLSQPTASIESISPDKRYRKRTPLCSQAKELTMAQ